MDRLDPIDALMMTAEVVSSPMHVGVLLTMTPPPGEDAGYVKRLYEQSVTDTAHVPDPRLRRRPYRGIDTGLLWVWRDCEVDIRHHVQRRTLPPGRGPEALWTLVSELHGLRLNRTNPLWMAYLIDGLAGGRFALYIKVHHCVIDGVAGLRMIADSLSPDPQRRTMPQFFAGRTPVSSPQPAQLHASMTRTVVTAVASAVGLGRRALAAQLRGHSVAAPFTAPRTCFNTRLGPRRAVAGISLERSRISAVRAAAGVTTNDVVTAAISGAVRVWLTERGALPDHSLVAICPVTVRGRDDDVSGDHGNRFGLGLCPLGTDLADPAERLIRIHAGMARVKHEVAERGPGAMLVALGPAIGPTVLLPLLPFDAKLPPSYNLPLSGVPGPPEVRYFNGARVDEIYPVSVVYDGMALNVTSCSYADHISLGFVADRDVVPDVAALARQTERALNELEEAFGVRASKP